MVVALGSRDELPELLVSPLAEVRSSVLAVLDDPKDGLKVANRHKSASLQVPAKETFPGLLQAIYASKTADYGLADGDHLLVGSGTLETGKLPVRLFSAFTGPPAPSPQSLGQSMAGPALVDARCLAVPATSKFGRSLQGTAVAAN